MSRPGRGYPNTPVVVTVPEAVQLVLGTPGTGASLFNAIITGAWAALPSPTSIASSGVWQSDGIYVINGGAWA